MATRIAILLGLGVAVVVAATPAPAGRFGPSKLQKAEQRLEYAPSAYQPAPPPPADGAIFHASAGYAPLTSGTRAAMVGDVLTILLVEKTQALKSNSASTNRDGSISVTPPATGPFSFFKPIDVGAGAGAKFAGKGGAEQSNSLSGQISVTIAQVYPNGTMLVRGEKQLTLNRGDEQIRISGLVRAVDIGFDNTIPSTRVADARITYTGKGEIARASQQGWLGRFFSRISPF
jgi:flagellar L-ring protein FlgH